MTDILIRKGRIIDPTQGFDFIGDILVRNGVIEEIAEKIEAPEVVQICDAQGTIVMPGLIDMHVHLREPGEEYKETIATGTDAACAGGFTAVACMPNTKPVNDNVSVTRFILDKASEAGKAAVLPVAAATVGQQGQLLTEFGDLLQAGAVAFSDDGLPISDASVMRLVLEYSRNFDALIISHSEEPSLSKGGSMNEGVVSTRLGLKGIPSVGEEIAIFRDIRLAALTGARLHIAHVSTKGGVEIIRRAKAEGIKVTAETAPHYFSLTEEAVEGFNTNAKMNPPLRTEDDRMAIIEGLQDGTLDAIATDHAPHSSLEKDCEFEKAANGIIGLELAVPLTLQLVREGYLELGDVVRLMSSQPAKILGIDAGSLKTGKPANITIIDPEKEMVVSRETLRSKSQNTPFLGKTLRGVPKTTIVNGLLVFQR